MQQQAQPWTAAATGPLPRLDRACYRYRTPVLIGPWRREADRACADAVDAGQARRDEDGSLSWLVNGDIERSLCDHDGPCGGIYPPD